MTKNLDRFERVTRLLLAATASFAAVALFRHPAARAAAGAFAAFALWEGLAAKCPMHALLGLRSPTDRLSSEAVRLVGLLGVQVALAYAWGTAAWEKLSNPEFLSAMARTLGHFASKNPFPWYKAFLENEAMKNAVAFGAAVEWSQAAIALALAASAAELVWGKREKSKRAALLVAALAFAGGMLMNANFYFAAGWTGPGTKGMNVVMFWTQAALLYVWLRSRASGSTAVRQ